MIRFCPYSQDPTNYCGSCDYAVIVTIFKHLQLKLFIPVDKIVLKSITIQEGCGVTNVNDYMAHYVKDSLCLG